MPITPSQLKALQSGKAKLTKLDSNSPLLKKLKKSGTMEKNRKCLVPKCPNVSGLFHQLPTNETRRKIWLSILGLQVYIIRIFHSLKHFGFSECLKDSRPN